MQVLNLDTEVMASINRVRTHAEDANNRNILSDVIAGRKGPPGADPRHVVLIPFAFKVVYSVDVGKEGECWRHISVSPSTRLSSPEDIFAICDAFGFDRSRMGIHIDGSEIVHVMEPFIVH